jgi:acetyl esterase/lipase
MSIPIASTVSLDPSATALLSPKFSKFDITSTPYKIINNQEIPVQIFIPKCISSGRHPILPRFHGGFLITGAALFPDFTAQWALDYCLQHSAIWVAPDYRLLPESKGLAILSNSSDFWTWVQEELPSYLRSLGNGMEPDYEHVMAYGESAGGYLALQTALTQGNLVKAVIAAFPMVDVDTPYYFQKMEGKSPFQAPKVPKEILDQHIASIPKGKIVVSGFPPERLPLAMIAIQQGVFTEMLGKDDKLYPLRSLEKMKASERVPFLFTYHGTDDRVVPPAGTQRLAREWEDKFGVKSIYPPFRPGDHGVGDEDSLEEPWLKEGLDRVTKAWLE